MEIIIGKEEGRRGNLRKGRVGRIMRLAGNASIFYGVSPIFY